MGPCGYVWRENQFEFVLMETIFWLGLFGTLYAYFLYPGLLWVLGKAFARPLNILNAKQHEPLTPSVTLVVPVYNESAVISSKLENFKLLNYPRDKLIIRVVSDGCTDNTIHLVKSFCSDLRIETLEVKERKGKANALNTGIAGLESDLVVFSDASILLEPDALQEIARPFQDPDVGCVSGEDHIAEGGGEGLYGQYELYLRNRESTLGSIVGASGSFYAQRTSLCKPFIEGHAPDFLSVLNTVEDGYRAITEPKARGFMGAVKSSSQEFDRKARTLLRGMTALFAKPHLLNPFRFGLFSLFLISHKIMRWLVPFFLVLVFGANLLLFEKPFYEFILVLQTIFYGLAGLATLPIAFFKQSILIKVPCFFVMVNLAIAAAWYRYLSGDRQELWNPSKRSIPGQSESL